jgi:DegV family protein with EDD domain
MRRIRILSDSACDLPEQIVKENDIHIIPYYISTNGADYLKDGVELSRDTFYAWMVANPEVFPKTSMPTVNDFMDVFEAAGEAGEDVICICISKKFSSTYRTAGTAAALTKEKFPDMRIEVIDSALATVMQGLFVLEACRLRDAGVSIDYAVTELKSIRGTGRIFFTIKNLDYLRHGGRIGKLTSIAGSLLGIRPIIALKEGELFSSGIVRSRSKSLDKVEHQLIEHIKENYTSPDEYRAVVGSGYDKEEGDEFRRRLDGTLQSIGHKLTLPVYSIGNIIGVHIGPYPIGAAVIKRAKLKEDAV